MRAFFAFFKKELLESLRSGKLILMGALFLAFGIMNPAIAKLTPFLMEMFAESLAESGMVITEISVNALTSWTQFFKNIPMALIVFAVAYGSTLTKEYDSGTLILILSKGMSRHGVLAAKWVNLLWIWSAGYWLCFGVTYGYNAYFWDNGIAQGLIPAAVCWWLFGVLVVFLLMLFSVLTKSLGGVLLCTGASVLAFYLIGLIPKAKYASPIALMNVGGVLTGVEVAGRYNAAIWITLGCCLACVVMAIPVFHKKQL